MKGFVPTPEAVVDLMVDKLFAEKPPSKNATLLDPGCGRGEFIGGVLRWCRRNGAPVPEIVGVESEPHRCKEARDRFAGVDSVHVEFADFLTGNWARFDYVIGNPPYVPITGLTEEEKATYRAAFKTAQGRFDLYLLFFELGLRHLKPNGRLVFITPEKFLYVKTAEPLRRLLGQSSVLEVCLLAEDTFQELVTYPTITTIDRTRSRHDTRFVLRDGSSRRVSFPIDGSSLLPLMYGDDLTPAPSATLGDICVRVSCGVATGADGVFVHKTASLNRELLTFAHPTISGRQLSQHQSEPLPQDSMLIPYDRGGCLLELTDSKPLADFLSQPQRKHRLLARTCVCRKPWFAFHETPPLEEILRPKLLCKDITPEPHFWTDREGSIVPRHSVYYVVPRHPEQLDEIADYLNGEQARVWMRANCQRAANGFLRLQSTVLKKLPIPCSFCSEAENSVQSAARRWMPIEQLTLGLCE